MQLQATIPAASRREKGIGPRGPLFTVVLFGDQMESKSPKGKLIIRLGANFRQSLVGAGG